MTYEDRTQRAARALKEARELLDRPAPEPYVAPPRMLGDDIEPEPEFVPEPAPERQLDTVPHALIAYIEQRFAGEREFMLAVVGEALGASMGDVQEAAEKELRHQVRELKAEIVRAQDAVTQLRGALDLERARIVDLPNPLQRRDLN